MRVLLSGATGYTGRGLADVLATAHTVRGLDIRAGDGAPADMLIGDLADLDICRQAVRDCDAIVMCHMAPNPDGYKTPPLAMDVNVKGTANLYHAAAEAAIRRVVLISTVGVLPASAPNVQPGDGPYHFGCKLYALTKIMQECLARFHFENDQIATIVLRPAWIVYDDILTTKYGEKMTDYNASLVDPRDIGHAVIKALALPDPGIAAFNLGQDDATFDQQATHSILDWHPQHRFATLKRSPA